MLFKDGLTADKNAITLVSERQFGKRMVLSNRPVYQRIIDVPNMAVRQVWVFGCFSGEQWGGSRQDADHGFGTAPYYWCPEDSIPMATVERLC